MDLTDYLSKRHKESITNITRLRRSFRIATPKYIKEQVMSKNTCNIELELIEKKRELRCLSSSHKSSVRSKKVSLNYHP